MGEPVEKLTKASKAKPITVYSEIGTDIHQQAYDQLEEACKLPVAISGTLLPDAHLGYALPVDGVAKMEPRVVIMGGGRKSDDGD